MFEPKVMFEPIDFSNPLIKIIFLIMGIVVSIACVGGLIWIIKDWNNVPEIFRHKVIPYMDDDEKKDKGEKKMNIKKFFTIVILLIICAFLLTACASTKPTTDYEEQMAEPMATIAPTQTPPTIGTFVVINAKEIFAETRQYIMYDPETMVMWSALYGHSSNGIGVSHSPMYNADGTLRIYNPTGK